MYWIERMKEASTWRGLALMATCAGVNVSPELATQITAAGVGVAGLLGTLLPDGKK